MKKNNEDWRITQEVLSIIRDYTPTEGLQKAVETLERTIEDAKESQRIYRNLIKRSKRATNFYRDQMKSTNNKEDQTWAENQRQVHENLIEQYKRQIKSLHRKAARTNEIVCKTKKTLEWRARK